MTRSMTYPLLTMLLAGALGCDDRGAANEVAVAPPGARPGPGSLPASSAAGLAAPAISVAQIDRATRRASAGLPVEARFLVLSANGSEPELARHPRGARLPRRALRRLRRQRRAAADRRPAGVRRHHGLYQATILTSSSLRWAACPR